MNRWPTYDEEQIADVVAVLRSGAVNAWTGPHVRDFEAAYEAHLGRRHCIALANGTLALDLPLRLMDLQPGDEVVVTPRSFVASASCVPLAGGVPVFADVDPDTQNLSAETIAKVLTPRTRAVIVVHLAGWPTDMAPIMDLCRPRGIAVIEDCAQAHGAEVGGRPVGSFGDFAAFSFCQDKIITTGGEGGLLALDDDALWRRAWSFKDHGKSYKAVFETQHPPGFRWLHESFGTNWRMTSIQAVLGSRQLQRLPAWTAARTRNAGILLDALADLPALRTPVPPPGTVHAWYRFYTFVRPERLKSGWTRDRLLAEIAAAGIQVFTGSCSEIYLEKAFQDAGYVPPERLPVARLLGETSLAFLVDPVQDEAVLADNARKIRRIVEAATLAGAETAAA
ncbi:DegT/DnrJ/EryC1/StrS family aminotransferase [Prosthecomicrobium sp. N25]|uniref:DegT/DnrJ/EryC1/StrS family aminotransferase n=1 Tax=Prosthecomicrobium sp. N25 TaxID=3129254 RepID=UPI0030788472